MSDNQGNKFEQAISFPVAPPGQMDEYDKRLQEFMGRETHTAKLLKARRARPKVKLDEMSFENDLAEHWYIYVLLVFSAAFSAMLGVYMGLAPMRLATGDLYFHTDIAHLALAVMYGLGFVIVTEFAFALAKWLYYTRESKNATQNYSMLAMMAVAGVSILGTGIAGGIVVASTVDFLTAFVAVPEWAQIWVVRVIPALIVLYSFLLTAYNLASTKAESMRIIRESQHEQELDQQTMALTLAQWAETEIQKAASKKYIQLVEVGTISAAEARAAIAAEVALANPGVSARPTNGQTRR